MHTSVSEQAENFAIFVGSLSANTTQEHLVEYFSQFGRVQGANLITDWATGASKRCGIVFCSDEHTLTAALAFKPHKLDGKAIRVSLADQEKKGTKKISTTNLFVGNISEKCSEQEMRLLFDKFGAIESIRFFKNASTKPNTKNAIIQYIDSKSVELAFKSKSEMGNNDDSLKISPLKQKKVHQTKVEAFEDMASMMMQIYKNDLNVPQSPSYGLNVRGFNFGQTMNSSFSEVDYFPQVVRRHRKSSSVDVLASKGTNRDYSGHQTGYNNMHMPAFNWSKPTHVPLAPTHKEPVPYKMKLISSESLSQVAEERPKIAEPEADEEQLEGPNNFITLIDLFNDDDNLSTSFYGVSPMRMSKQAMSNTKSSRLVNGDSSSDCPEELNSDRASQ
jgi:RNA recognition motif-containing protein